MRVGTDFNGCYVDESDAPFTIVSEVEVEAPNGGESYQATVVPPSFGGLYIMNNATIYTDGGQFYDDGGAEGNYSGAEYTKYFWPSTPNNELRMTIAKMNMAGDALRFYDATTGASLGAWGGTTSEPISVQGKGLRVVYDYTCCGTSEGWVINIESIDVTYDDTTYLSLIHI